MGTSSFSGVTSGLTSTYSLLSNAAAGNVTSSSITSAMNNSSYASSLNSGFASYLLSNFSSLDNDSNGTLSSTELSTLTSNINSRGLTSAQLSQLGSASGLSGDALAKVLEHFADIDTNGDGKVTSAEISGYKITSAMENKKAEFANKFATDQSMFYGNDDAKVTDSSSIVSWKYMADNNSSGS